MSEKTDPFANPRYTADGKVQVPVSRATRKAMNKLRQPGETDDQLITRIMDIGDSCTAVPPSMFPRDSTLDTILAAKAGLVKPIGMDEKVHLSDDPTKNRFVVMPKADLDPGAFPANEHERETAEKLAKVLEPLSPGQQRRVLRKVSQFNFGDEAAQTHHLKSDVDTLEHKIAAGKEVMEIAVNPKLQRLGESCYHKLRTAWLDGSIITPVDDVAPIPPELRNTLGERAEIFVVQHDWAAAFKNAQDFAEGEYRLPYTESAFEFRLSGKRVICNVLADRDASPFTCIINVETSVGWMLVAVMAFKNGKWEGGKKIATTVGTALMAVCGEQIKAIAVALEAKVAETEVIRAPHKLNAKRERAGKLPIYDYHVVSLAHRQRALPRDLSAESERERRHGVRLHFRRGHWRHFQNGEKTWIKWMLVGDPELGFVDKHYKL